MLKPDDFILFFSSGDEVGPLMVELPADSGEAKVAKKVKKSGETFDKYFANGEESRRSGRTSELSTWMDSVLLKEVASFSCPFFAWELTPFEFSDFHV